MALNQYEKKIEDDKKSKELDTALSAFNTGVSVYSSLSDPKADVKKPEVPKTTPKPSYGADAMGRGFARLTNGSKEY